MDLHHLKYFLVVAEEGTFHKASERLKVAPSALARRIQDLEAELGIALFERTSSGIKLSYAGRTFVDYAQRILAEVDAAAEHLMRLVRGQNDILRIGLNGIAPQLPLVPRIFRAFRSTYPKIELKLMSLSSEEQLIALRDGTIDAGFLYTRPEQSEDFDHLRLGSHRFMAVMTNDHRLAGHAALKLADLAGEDFVFFTRASGSIVHDRIIANCRAGGLEPRIVQETVGEHMQLGLVAAGMGISFVNETVATRQLRPELVIKPVSDLTVAEHLDLTWRRGDTSVALGQLIELAKRA